MSERSYRIRTNVNEDKVVKVTPTQDVDFLEILSLKLNQEDIYRLHTANYGVLVGRVLANEAFGVPNAKISIFIEVDDEDKTRSEIFSLYPYVNTSTKDSENRRYNLLPSDSSDDCYRIVGSFPTKRIVLDNDTEIEIFDKYWKYTTVTNSAGDYMIYGIPVGNQTIHVDIDLSDCGILSQRPRDFFYKGYPITQFDNATQFKESTNLDNLSQIISQNSSVYIYPFWGDSNMEEIAISRHDVQIQYKFESTCVFMGSIVTDSYGNNFNHKCTPSKHVGYNQNLVAPEGTIEMIRKTPDGLVEDFQIQGNQLIDGDGIFCYQIPMNLDYVGTDEYGNIVPTDDPNKGIATKTTVRFRFTIQETHEEGISRHRARYLVPNNPTIIHGSTDASDTSASAPFLSKDDARSFDRFFTFGSATPDDCYRDLYWNKVYSVKNYVPRLQTTGSKSTENYSCLRSNNLKGNLNPIPFNNIRIRLSFNYKLLCLVTNIIVEIIYFINKYIVCFLDSICIPLLGCIFKIGCVGFNMVAGEDDDSNAAYYPGCSGKKCRQRTKCPDDLPKCRIEWSTNVLMDKIQQSLSVEYDLTNLDFCNDWLNGCMYFPLWFWKKTKKKKFLFGLFTKKAQNRYCNCDEGFKKLRLTQPCDISFEVSEPTNQKKYHRHMTKVRTKYGIVKETQNKAGLNLYYYTPGLPVVSNYNNTEEDTPYVRLYATDIILLGTLNNCDMDNIPQLFSKLPSTTSNIPYITAVVEVLDDAEEGDISLNQDDEEENTEKQENGILEVSGMDWLYTGEDDAATYKKGLFFDLACLHADTRIKTCINVGRMSELGVSFDGHIEDVVAKDSKLMTNIIQADGMITRYELVDNETRAMFASMNHEGLTHKVKNINTGYDMYKLSYIYPVDFDGRMQKEASAYTKMMDVKTYDTIDDAYINFRYGLNEDNNKKFFYLSEQNDKDHYFPIYNNSFFFFFGLNAGNTAIDKFYTNFYSDCFTNVKYPFTLSIASHSAKWCATNITEDYATAEINLEGIKIPYSYTLSDDFGNVIMAEKGMTEEVLKFGYDVQEGGGKYLDAKYGAFKYFLTGQEIEPQTFFTNGVYTISVTDVNQNTVSEKIYLNQTQIEANFEAIELGAKYYQDITAPRELCNDAQLYGEIKIESIVIDGIEHKITSHSEILKDTTYQITCDDGSLVQLTIEPQIVSGESGESLSLSECGCHDVNNIPTYDSDVTDEVDFKIWIPGLYQLTFNQICDNELNDNVTTYLVEIKNGEPFNAYVNTVPMKFMVGSTDKPMTPSYFYQKSSSNPSTLLGWFNLDDEKSYLFSAVTKENKEIWDDFVTISTDEDGNFDSESLTNIVQSKFEWMLELSKTAYVTESDTDNYLALTHTGGKSPVVYRGLYPLYSEFKNGKTEDFDKRISDISDENKEWVVDSEAYVVCDKNTANIVPFNYVYYNKQDLPLLIPTKIKDRKVKYVSGGTATFNPLFDKNDYLGNYLAAFTRDGSIVRKGDSYQKDSSIKYQSVPFSATSYLDNDGQIMTKGEVEIDDISDFISHNDFFFSQKTNFSYFKGEFVDRRIGYSFILFTPYGGEDFDISTDTSYFGNTKVKKKDLWKYGRLFGAVYNGVEMAYSKSGHNVIQKLLTPTDPQLLEYAYYVETGTTNPKAYTQKYVPTTDDKRRFFSSTLKTSKAKFDIIDAYQALGRTDVFANEQLYSYKHINNNGISNEHIQMTSGFGGYNINDIVFPTKRVLDIGLIPSSSKLTFDVTSCSYDIVPEFNNDIDALVGEVGEGEKVEFSIDCRNKITPNIPTLEECAANSTYNVSFDYKSNIDVFLPNKMSLEMKLASDGYNTTHYSFTKRPFLVKADTLSSALTKDTVEEVIATLKQKNSLIEFGYDKSSISNIKEEDRMIHSGVFDSTTYSLTNDSKYWVSDNDDENVITDDTSEAKSVVYKMDKSIGDWGVAGVIFERNYINADRNNILREIKTFQVSAIYDVRPISINLIVNDVTTSNLDATSTTPAKEATDGGEAQEEQVNNTMVQSKHTIMIFKINQNIGDGRFNQQLVSGYDKISGIFKYDDKITSSVQFFSQLATKYTNERGEEKVLNYKKEDGTTYMMVNWTGDLNNVFLPSFKNGHCQLYLSMPNKLVYQLNFKAKKYVTNLY